MNRGVLPLLVAQFITAFGDNAILFAAIGMVLQADDVAGWYIPALQSSFLVAYVVSAPWVGPVADRFSKARVLLLGNLVKAIGTGLILVGVEPLFAYALVGLGAAIYSPAKYGILPELVPKERLVKANGWIEGSTIAAIIIGAVVGGYLADYSVSGAFLMVLVLYLISMLVTLLIPLIAAQGGTLKNALPNFTYMLRGFLDTPRARFAMLGGSLFWGASAVLRLLLVAWAPLVLGIHSAGDISALALFIAVGIIIGALIAPRFIPLEQLRRARLAAYAMGIMILLFSLVGTPMFSLVSPVWDARLVLLLTGIAGGIFLVPINAALQDIGHNTIGSGRAVAIQNFFQNFAMLVTVGLYTLAAASDVHPVTTVVALGILILLATVAVALHLPKGDALPDQSE
ncbi:MAG: lysophospholipid transporter LplT [Gammaproteobacteria bacterium]|nr:MAG: lysophospholipid transporter LplT [Gammaproteobacteria bacterium]